jgi:hypothetical protein
MIILESSALSRYLKKYENVYPGIDLWYQKKVEPDIMKGVKVIFRFDKNFDVEGMGIVDIVQGKLCHLSIEYAMRGSGLGKFILYLAKREIKNNGHDSMWCHAPENVADKFIKWSRSKPVEMLHNFGRNGIKDVKMVLSLGEVI